MYATIIAQEIRTYMKTTRSSLNKITIRTCTYICKHNVACVYSNLDGYTLLSYEHLDYGNYVHVCSTTTTNQYVRATNINVIGISGVVPKCKNTYVI